MGGAIWDFLVEKKGLFGLRIIAWVLSVAAARIEGLRLARSLEVTGYRETMIKRLGFDGPVGPKIEIQVSHGTAPDGLVYPPEIRMGSYIEVPLDDAFGTAAISTTAISTGRRAI